MTNGATFAVALNGPGTFSQMNVAGLVNLAGNTSLSLQLNFAPAVGQQFMIVNAGTLLGRFTQGQVISASFGGRTYYFAISYTGGDGNDIVLTTLPFGTIFTVL
jgi:hypothetical protein